MVHALVLYSPMLCLRQLYLAIHLIISKSSQSQFQTISHHDRVDCSPSRSVQVSSLDKSLISIPRPPKNREEILGYAHSCLPLFANAVQNAGVEQGQQQQEKIPPTTSHQTFDMNIAL